EPRELVAQPAHEEAISASRVEDPDRGPGRKAAGLGVDDRQDVIVDDAVAHSIYWCGIEGILSRNVEGGPPGPRLAPWPAFVVCSRHKGWPGGQPRTRGSTLPDAGSKRIGRLLGPCTWRACRGVQGSLL